MACTDRTERLLQAQLNGKPGLIYGGTDTRHGCTLRNRNKIEPTLLVSQLSALKNSRGSSVQCLLREAFKHISGLDVVWDVLLLLPVIYNLHLNPS